MSAGSTITASGELFNAHSGHLMTVTLFKLVGTTYQQVAATRPQLGAYGTYSTTFTDPGADKCKVVARFAGDADHRASQKARPSPAETASPPATQWPLARSTSGHWWHLAPNLPGDDRSGAEIVHEPSALKKVKSEV